MRVFVHRLTINAQPLFSIKLRERLSVTRCPTKKEIGMKKLNYIEPKKQSKLIVKRTQNIVFCGQRSFPKFKFC
jgi:hypothetical protein